MAKILVKKVPKKTDYIMQHKIMKAWSETMVKNHTSAREIRIIASKEIISKKNDT